MDVFNRSEDDDDPDPDKDDDEYSYKDTHNDPLSAMMNFISDINPLASVFGSGTMRLTKGLADTVLSWRLTHKNS